MTRPSLLDPDDVATWLSSHPQWNVVDSHLVGVFESPFDDSIRALAAVNDAVNRLNHHPRVTLEYASLTVECWTHDRGGITSLDLSLAEEFERVLDQRT